MNKLYLYQVSLVILFLACFSLLYVYLVPHHFLKVLNAPVPLSKYELKRGEAVPFLVDYCFYKNAPVYKSAEFVDQNDYPVVASPVYRVNYQRGCTNGARESSIFLIPRFIKDGTYHLRITVEMDIFGLRKSSYQFETLPFKIKGVIE